MGDLVTWLLGAPLLTPPHNSSLPLNVNHGKKYQVSLNLSQCKRKIKGVVCMCLDCVVVMFLYIILQSIKTNIFPIQSFTTGSLKCLISSSLQFMMVAILSGDSCTWQSCHDSECWPLNRNRGGIIQRQPILMMREFTTLLILA